MRLVFLGTGASGGTPGAGRSRRRESSLLISDATTVLLDVTRDFARQSEPVTGLDAILLTHGHGDAIGGLPALRRWWLAQAISQPVDVFASAATIAVIRARYPRLEHCRLRVLGPGRSHRVGAFAVRALTVPHAREPRFATYAWRIDAGASSVVYASDVASLTPELERLCAGASALVLDGALWRRRLFSHLTIDESLPHVCAWPVESIFLTQIGRSAPPHPVLEHEVAAICPRARPAYDGLTVTV